MRRRFRFLRSRTGAIGAVIAVTVIALALFGPFFAPYGPGQLLSEPGVLPGHGQLFGTDFLGRDVLSRVLWGGRSVLLDATLATLLGYAVGGTVGLVAGYSRSFVDPLLMRTVDIVRAFPPLLFFFLLVAGAGQSSLVLVVGVAAVQAPGIARLIHTATVEVSLRGYVEAAVARGDSTVTILRREVLPNILTPVIADFGLRSTFSILFVITVDFLGLGIQPPNANWALMISENREILTLNPWAIFVPAALIALLTIGVNLIGDAIARSLGRTEVLPP